MKTTFGLAALILAGLCGAASAQDAKDNFSYKAPSGMFSEGTTKWGMYQFMESDAEHMAKVRSGQGDVATGALSTSSSQSYPRPGERSTSPRRPTSH